MEERYKLPPNGRILYFDDDAKAASVLEIDATQEKVDIRSLQDIATNIAEVVVSAENKHYASCDGVLYSKGTDALPWYPPEKDESTYEIPRGVKRATENSICGYHLRRIVGGGDICSIAPGFCSLEVVISLDEYGIQSNLFISIDGVLYDNEQRSLILCPSKTACNLEKRSLRIIKTHALIMNKCISNVVLCDELETIECGAFLGSEIESLTGGFGLTTIGIGAFANCQKLETVVFQSGLQSIGTGAFNNCRRLKELIIPNTVRSIGYDRSYSTISKKTTILCESGSFADSYAREYGYTARYM